MENKVILTALILIGALAVSCVAIDFGSIQCYRCQGYDCSRTNTQVMCNKGDGCATIYDPSGITKRDCVTLLSSDERGNCAKNSGCEVCKDNLCNIGNPFHKCIQCNSTVTAECDQNPTSINETSCANDNVVSSPFYCYSQINLKTGEIIRGCVNNDRISEDCAKTPDTCVLYQSGDVQSATNITTQGRRKCRVCSTLENTDCPLKKDSPEEQVNKYSEYCNDPNDQCVYIDKTDQKSGVFQKCNAHQTQNDTAYCVSYASSCTTCAEDNCNYSFATRNVVNTALIAFTSLFIAKFY